MKFEAPEIKKVSFETENVASNPAGTPTINYPTQSSVEI